MMNSKPCKKGISRDREKMHFKQTYGLSGVYGKVPLIWQFFRRDYRTLSFKKIFRYIKGTDLKGFTVLQILMHTL